MKKEKSVEDKNSQKLVLTVLGVILVLFIPGIVIKILQ
jgi:hypothetical protein